MHLHFTEEDEHTRLRARDLRLALVREHHHVTHGVAGEAVPAGADVWVHALGWNPTLPPAVPLDRLRAFGGELVIIQVCDHVTMHFHRLTSEVERRAASFLRNHWPADASSIPHSVAGRIGLLPPMLRPFRVRRGADLRDRPTASMFFGTKTGGHFALPDGSNARETLVRKMRASGLRFEGGLTPNTNPVYAPAPDVVVPRIGDREHARRLGATKLCLAAWGNHPLTYRLFEGMALRCLVLAQSIEGTRFIDGGMKAGTHYVEIAADLSDLVDKARYYLAHLDEAQRIADAGHALYLQRFAYRGGAPSKYTFDESVKTWGAWYRPAPVTTARERAMSLAAAIVPSIF